MFLSFQLESLLSEVHKAIENGHRKSAAKIVSEAVRMGGFGYNFLHEEVHTLNLLLTSRQLVNYRGQ